MRTRLAALGSTFAVAAVLAAAVGPGAQEAIPAADRPPTIAGAPPTAGPASDGTQADRSAGLSREQVQAAMQEAEERRTAAVRPDPDLAAALREKWGVEVVGIWLTSAGYMLDFRFRVVDVDKALSLFDHRINPYVLTDRAKVKLPVPMAAKVGAFRPTNRGKNIRADKTYYMVFGNPDNFVKAGEKVSVVIGDFRAENLTVR
jgi:hypothetical protein